MDESKKQRLVRLYRIVGSRSIFRRAPKFCSAEEFLHHLDNLLLSNDIGLERRNAGLKNDIQILCEQVKEFAKKIEVIEGMINGCASYWHSSVIFLQRNFRNFQERRRSVCSEES